MGYVFGLIMVQVCRASQGTMLVIMQAPTLPEKRHSARYSRIPSTFVETAVGWKLYPPGACKHNVS